MSEHEIIDKIRDVLRDVGCDTYKVYAFDANSVMVYGAAMYERPANIDSCAEKLAEIVGSIDALLDPVSVSGCESCDWGSQYGTEFLFRKASFVPSKTYSGEVQ